MIKASDLKDVRTVSSGVNKGSKYMKRCSRFWGYINFYQKNSECCENNKKGMYWISHIIYSEWRKEEV